MGSISFICCVIRFYFTWLYLYDRCYLSCHGTGMTIPTAVEYILVLPSQYLGPVDFSKAKNLS